MLTNIRIILVNTSHPGNIGSAARAMKTMGLSELYLVNPVDFPNSNANALASNAADVVENAIVVNDVSEALEECGLIVGASARSRTIPWPMLSPRAFAEKAMIESAQNKVAILFGREQSGLTNEELQRCHFHVNIPSNPDYSSLNLASAVQVIAYELRVASQLDIIQEEWDYPFATGKELDCLYAHLEKVLIDVEFLKPEVPRQLMPRLRRLYNRARLDTLEIKMLRGILSAVEKKII